MARLFDDSGTDQWLSIASVPVTVAPLTLATWVYPDANVNMGVFEIVDTGNSGRFFRLRLRDPADTDLMAWAQQGGSSGFSTSASQFSLNTWQHIGGVFTSTTSRTAYLDGAAGTPETTEVAPFSLDSMIIGRAGDSSPDNYVSGRVAEAALWDVALTAGEMLTLAAGYSPLFVRPQSLIAYWPLIRDDNDRVGGFNMTVNGSPTFVDGPPIIYPAAPHIIGVAEAGEPPSGRIMASLAGAGGLAGMGGIAGHGGGLAG